MILPDVNILLYAVNRSSDQHSAAFTPCGKASMSRAVLLLRGPHFWVFCASALVAAFFRSRYR